MAKFATLTAACGASRSTVYFWLSGHNLPSAEKMLAVQKLTGITPNEWYRWLWSVPTTEDATR